MTISSFKDQIPTVIADLNYCFRGADAPLVGSDGLSSRNKSFASAGGKEVESIPPPRHQLAALVGRNLTPSIGGALVAARSSG